MGNFQGGGNRGGGGFRGGQGVGNRGGGGYRGNGGDRAEVTMHKAVCDECHKSCEVPFRPSSDKPVFCNDCFSSKRKDDDRGGRKDFGDRAPRREFNGQSAPSFAKPVTASNDNGKQLSEISAKLDRLIVAMEKIVAGSNEQAVSKKIPAEKIISKQATKVVTKPVAVKSVAKVVAKKVVAKKKTK